MSQANRGNKAAKSSSQAADKSVKHSSPAAGKMNLSSSPTMEKVISKAAFGESMPNWIECGKCRELVNKENSQLGEEFHKKKTQVYFICRHCITEDKLEKAMELMGVLQATLSDCCRKINEFEGSVTRCLGLEDVVQSAVVKLKEDDAGLSETRIEIEDRINEE